MLFYPFTPQLWTCYADMQNITQAKCMLLLNKIDQTDTYCLLASLKYNDNLYLGPIFILQNTLRNITIPSFDQQNAKC